MVGADPASTHGAARLPEGVPEDAASLFVMPAVALGGVDMANPRMGQTVVVHGCGQIGLGAVAWCVLRGCVVIAVDLQDNRLEVAKLIKQGKQQLAENNPEEARVSFEKAATLAPDNEEVRALLKKALAAIEQKKNEGIIEAARERLRVQREVLEPI